MTIIEFIESQYPVKDRIRARLEDPYKRVEMMDNLPYDTIGPDEYGKVTKLVEVDDDRYISVMELIGMEENEVVATKDDPLIKVWKAYMSQIDIEDINISDIMDCVRKHNASMALRKEQLDVLSV